MSLLLLRNPATVVVAKFTGLKGTVWKSGTKKEARLTWPKANARGANVAVWRRVGTGEWIRQATTANDGAWAQNMAGKKGIVRYYLRDGQGRQSNTVILRF